MSGNKKELIIDEKTRRRNIALSRRAAEMANEKSSSVSISGAASGASVSMSAYSRDVKKSDVAKSNTGFKSVGTKSKSSADNIKKQSSGLGPKAHGASSNYSGMNNFGLK
jgi:hypothetical protein